MRLPRMNRTLPMALLAAASLCLTACEVTSTGTFMQWDDHGARAGKLALVSFTVGLDVRAASDVDDDALAAGLARDLLVAAEDCLHEKFDVQPAKGFVADAAYRANADGVPREGVLIPKLDGQALATFRTGPGDFLSGDRAARLATDLGCRYVAVAHTTISSRMVDYDLVFKRNADGTYRRSEDVQTQMFVAVADTRLTIYNRVGFPVVEAHHEGIGGPLLIGRPVRSQLGERDGRESAARAVQRSVKAVMEKVRQTRTSIEFDG